MPIKYIGRKTNFAGNTLWEIVGNLKNGGVGRIVSRHVFERYSEPCFFKILKVDALPNEEIRKVKVLVERTFRGVKYPKPIEINSVSYKADYRLIPKEKEAEYCKFDKPRTMAVLPRTVDLPPLYKELLLKDMKSKGKPVTEDPKMEIYYKIAITNHYRIAEEGETPTVEVHMGLGKTSAPRLYENIEN